MRGRSRTALGPLLLATVVSACSATPPPVSTHDLDRPTDMVFGCVGLFPEDQNNTASAARPSGRPMLSCQKARSTSINRTFAFVTNSARGELSVVDMDNSKLVDLDLAVAGYNTAPLGELPEALAISDDGCRVVSANRGSCDLTVVDPGLLMAPTIARTSPDAGVPDPPGTVPTQTIPVRTGSGKPLQASPYEVQFLPQDTGSLVTIDDTQTEIAPGPEQLCPSDHPLVPPLGWSKDSPLALSGWKALVTFPACDLVALVDLPSGIIIDSVRVNADVTHVALQHVGSEPSCPIECGVGARPVVDADGGLGDLSLPPDAVADSALGDTVGSASDDGADGGLDSADGNDDALMVNADGGAANDAADAGSGEQEAGTAPEVTPPPPAAIPDTISRRGAGPLAVHPLGGRAYVGLTSFPKVAAISIEADTGRLQTPDDHGATISLDGALGVRRLRLSVDPFTSTKNLPFVHRGDNQTRKYLYVIAADGTVRVVNVDSQQECDNNVDLSKLTDADRKSACLTDPSLHNPLITGPGIHLPANPRDVAFALVSQPATPDGKIPLENQLDGAFGFILTDGGSVYLTNIDPTLRQVAGVIDGKAIELQDNLPVPSISEETPPANSLRDRNFVTYSTTQDPASGPPRLDVPPVAPVYGARIEGFWAEDTKDNYTATIGIAQKTYVYFPEREVVTPQTWTVTWEGSLIGLRFSGLRKGPLAAPENGAVVDSILYDGGGGFCDAGVVAGDIVTMLGCTADAQCGAGQVCRRNATVAQSAGGLAINGLCVNPDPSIQDMQVNHTCRRLLESIRRYEVIVPHPDRLVLRPHKDEVVQTYLDPNRCPETWQEMAMGKEGPACGPSDAIDPSFSRFRCRDVGEGSTMDIRCVSRCGQPKSDKDPMPSIEQGDADCRLGRKCVDFGGKVGRLCADAPSDAEEGTTCFPQLTTYSVQAGRSYLVQGSATGIPVAVRSVDPSTPADPNAMDPPLPQEPVDDQNPLGAGATASVCRPLISQPAPPSGQPMATPPPSSPLAYRIPMNAPRCTIFPPGIPDLLALDTNVKPDDKTSTANYAPLNLLRQAASPDPNPCLFLAGPNEGDISGSVAAVAPADGGMADGNTADGGGADGSARPPAGPPAHVRARFRNPQLQFILSNIEQQFVNVSQIRFDVHGGFVAQAVLAPATVEIGLPARLVSSPLVSVFGAAAGVPTPTAPYLFVVDQRRIGRNRLAGGATRGQILRINLQRYNTGDPNNPLLIYDDLSSTAGLFPIQ